MSLREWEELTKKPLPNGEFISAVQLLAYTKGYILALQDVLKDIKELDSRTPGMEAASQELIDKIHQSLGEATRTLEHLL